MMHKLAAAILIISSAAPGAAQSVIDNPRTSFLSGATLLSVAVEGRVQRAPDVADLSAGVVTQAATATEAMRANAERMTTVIAALKRAGIAERDIQTSGINLNPQYVYRENQPPQLTGYQVINNVTVRARNLSNLGRTIDALVSQGANQINGPMFRLDKPDAALDNARVEAVAKARSRAQLYADAVGMRVKRIVQINESSGMASPYPIPIVREQSMAAKDASTPVAPGEVEATANVNVVFELE